MLQPLQLEEVRTRYANEIAELQDFLQKAGCLPGAPESLHAIVKRLQRDRAFHRDLTSYIWVVIHSGNRNISYADLLGVLAVAAAGGRYAAEAEEDDAHALLRFVIEAREALDGTGRQKTRPAADPEPVAPPPPPVESRSVESRSVHSQPAEPEPVPQQPVKSPPVSERPDRKRPNQPQPDEPQPAQSQPVEPRPRPARSRSVRWQQTEQQQVQSQPVESQPVEPRAVELEPVKSEPYVEPTADDDGPIYPHARPFPEEFSPLKDEEEEGSRTRKRLIWLTVCFLAVALVARIAFHNLNLNALNETASPATPAATSPAESTAPTTNHEDTPASPHTEAAPQPEADTPVPPATAEKDARIPRAGSQSRGTHRGSSGAYSPASPQPATGTTPATQTTPAGPAPKIPEGPAPKIPPAPASRTPPAPGAAPISTPRAAPPSEPDLTNTDRGRAVPHLLRRTAEEQAELADASPPANMPAPANTSTAAASRSAPAAAAPAAPHGSVRAISLGVNASNVLYSPTPAYPQAASAAHIQGDVKVETNVDRNGNVASVRVVSGPPLLRDAALDAAQRWRYRPHFIGGEQAAMSTITVFEFQLP